MGAGKTTVGRMLAEKRRQQFIDLDEWIEAHERRSVAEIFHTAGESGFREIESHALAEVIDISAASVVALGGGTFVHPRNPALVRETGAPIVFLDAHIEELWRRCENQRNMVERPVLQDRESFWRLYDGRRAAYETGTWRLDTTGKPSTAVVEEIECWLAQQLQIRQGL